MADEKIEPVVLHGFSEKESPVVVKNSLRENNEAPVVIKKKKTKVRKIELSAYQKPDTQKIKLKNLASNMISFFLTKGYTMNEKRGIAFIASMLSSRLLFLNSTDEDKLDLLFEYFGCMPNVIDKKGFKSFVTSDTLKALYSARKNNNGVSLVVIKADSEKDLEYFKGFIMNPSGFNTIPLDAEINGREIKNFVIPENVWILVLTDNDHDYKIRKYGAYAKLSLTQNLAEEAEYVIPSYDSFKDAFIDVRNPHHEAWELIDEIVELTSENGYEFDNKTLNMLDDYFISLTEMGMDYLDAIDFAVVNRILYMTGDEMVLCLKKFSRINSLKHTSKKIERMM